MKMKALLLGLAVCAGLLTIPQQLHAAAFMKFDGIDGESTDAQHSKWIDVLSYDWGIVRPLSTATGSTRTRGSAQSLDFVCVKELDKASPKLMEMITTGQVKPLVEIHLTRNTASGPVTYMKYELKNVIITSWSTSGSAGDQRPTEQVSLNFEEIKVIYTEFDNEGQSKGNVEATWKVEEGVS